MPEGDISPRDDEDKDDFITRCVEWFDENEPDVDQDERVARCYKIYRDSKGEDVNESQDLTRIEVSEQAAGSFDSDIELDRDNNIIRNLAILGAESPTHSRRYTDEALREAAEVYEGLAVYVDEGRGQHEDTTADGRSSPKNLLGKTINTRYDPNKKQVRGDLQVMPREVDFIFPLAESMPTGGPGFSPKHAVAVTYEGQEEVVHGIVKAHQIDLVTHPSTVRGLAESENPDSEPDESIEEESIMNRSELESKHPEIVQAVESDAREPLEDKVETLEDEKSELQDQLEAAESELDELKAEKAVREKREKVNKKVAESSLPDEAVTDTFIEGLMRADDEDSIEAQIEDRVELVSESTRPSIPERKGFKGGGAADEDVELSEHARNLRG